jgi:hypothetical protein
MAGPSGTKLIDLHMTDRGQTTEMFSPNVKLDPDSLLRNVVNDSARDWRKNRDNIVSSVGVFGANVAIICVALGLSDYFLLGPRLVYFIEACCPGAAQVTGTGVVSGIAVLLISAALVAILEYAGLMAKLRKAMKFEDLSPLDEDASFSGIMKPKAKQLHFGNLPVSYDITDKGLLIRSLGDRFVAVLAVTPESGVDIPSGDAAKSPYRAWYGDNLTPPVIIKVETAAYGSELVIHGRHFETPGADKEDCMGRAEAFKEALLHPPASHDDHH